MSRGARGSGAWPLTLLTVPAPGSLPPVADCGLRAGLVVHPVTAAGHIWAVPTKRGVGQASPPMPRMPSQSLPSPCLVYPDSAEALFHPRLVWASRPALSADQYLLTMMIPCSAAQPPTGLGRGPSGPPGSVPLSSYWKEGGRESPMPPIRSSGGGRSVWPSVA